MNILPHKSWHVRTKKNIARVRADEAKAAEEEKEKQRRIALAVQEDRTRFLRERASKRDATDQVHQNEEESSVASLLEESSVSSLPLTVVADITQPNGHINFFQEIEDGTKLDGAANKEHEEEKKKEQEDYEKKIGYLVYLGQNSLEHSKDKPWYERIERGSALPSKSSDKNATSATSATQKEDQKLFDLKLEKLKEFQDPLKDIRKYLSTSGVKKCLKTTKESEASESKRKKLDSDKKVHSSDSVSSKKHKKHKKEKKKHKDKKHKSRSYSPVTSSSRHHKKRKHRHSSPKPEPVPLESESESDDSVELKKKQDLEKLRAERLERERLERRKAEKLLEKLKNPNGEIKSDNPELEFEAERGVPSGRQLFPIAKQKYNSQFNPHLARQNYDN